jgi:hypothetical protein
MSDNRDDSQQRKNKTDIDLLVDVKLGRQLTPKELRQRRRAERRARNYHAAPHVFQDPEFYHGHLEPEPWAGLRLLLLVVGLFLGAVLLAAILSPH